MFSDYIIVIEAGGCLSSPCMNAGNCTHAGDGYTCNCTQGYSGVHCQTGKVEVMVELLINVKVKVNTKVKVQVYSLDHVATSLPPSQLPS